MDHKELIKEFDRQVENLISKGYPQLMGNNEKTFLPLVRSLKNKIPSQSLPPIDMQKGTLPFVLVVQHTLIPSEAMMAKTEKDGNTGVTILRPHSAEQFNPTPDVEIPQSYAYLLIDIDRGKETLNVTPLEAKKTIESEKRSPLAIDEGIAIITQYPEFLQKNNCFSLLASRTGTDKRVPALWINAKKQPNLGWCWEGNPHTWLGSASCLTRIG